MAENNVMFLHLPSFALVASCVVFFLAGSFAETRGSRKLLEENPARSPMRPFAVALPIVSLTFINLFSLGLLLSKNPDLLTGWLTDGQSAKLDLDATGAMTNALPALYCVCWWGLWRLMECERALNKRIWILRAILACAVITAIYTAIVKVARYDLLPCIFGLSVVFLAHKHSEGKLKIVGSAASFAALICVVLAVFVAMAWIRGSDAASMLSKNLMGYTAASYNRLAALLDGDINFPYAGTGVYAFKFLTYIPFLNRWIDFADIFGMPQKEESWLSEFGAVAQSGLDGSYIWSSAFGYVYSDIGLLCIAYFFALGIISKSAWRSLVRGNTFGLIFYPWASFSIVFWMGDNFVAHSKVIVLLGTCVVIRAYEILARSKITT